MPIRRYFWLRLAAIFLFVCSAPLQAREPLKTWGYVASWMGDGWRMANIQQFDRILFFEIKIGGDGSVVENNGWPERWRDLLEAADSHRVPVDLTLTMFSAEHFNMLFSRETHRKAFVNQIVQLARSPGVSGIHLDFELYEGTNADAVELYRRTVRELAAKLSALTPARALSVFYPMGGTLDLYDRITLKALNAIVFQGYDAHWSGAPTAGPLSPLKGGEAATWENVLIHINKNQIETTQALISFPLYGYEWPVKGPELRSEAMSKARITTFAPVPPELLPDIQISVASQVARYGAHYDTESGSSYYKFSPQPGTWVEGWFEDWWTLEGKIQFIKEKKIGGIAFFPLGYDAGRLVGHYKNRISGFELTAD